LPKVAGQKWQAINGDHNTTSEENTKSKGIPSVSPASNQSKASTRAVPVRSLAVLLEDLATIPADLWGAARSKHQLPAESIEGEWAKFRNHHISARSKHTRVDLCWDTCKRCIHRRSILERLKRKSSAPPPPGGLLAVIFH
jgi:hypothetical protein